MTQAEGYNTSNPWYEKVPWIEEARADSHLEKLRIILGYQRDRASESGNIMTRIAFTRIAEKDGMVSAMPGFYTGILLGIEENGEPSAIIGDYQGYLCSNSLENNHNTPCIDVKLEEADIITVRLTEIDEIIQAETGDPENWINN